MLGEGVNERGKSQLVLEDGRDVVKQNAGLGKVGNFPDQPFERFAVHGRLGSSIRHHHAPSIRKVIVPGLTVASSSSTSSTRAARGPCLSLVLKLASCSREPWAITSTLPSALFRTQPATPSMCASCSTNQRKPTPCTRPRTMKRAAETSLSEEVIAWLTRVTGKRLRRYPRGSSRLH